MIEVGWIAPKEKADERLAVAMELWMAALAPAAVIDFQLVDMVDMCWSTLVVKLGVKAKMENTRDLLNWLKAQYGTTSISAAYTDVVIVNKLYISGDCDPTPTLDRLLVLFMRLEDNKLIYPESIQAMTHLAKLPPQMEIACNYNQRASDATSLTFATICNDAIMNWQQRSSKGKQQQSQQGIDAKKLSNIQQKGKDP